MKSEDTILLFAIFVFFILCLTLIAVAVYFGHRFLKLKEKELESAQKWPGAGAANISKEILENLKDNKQEIPVETGVCVDHPSKIAQRTCALSGESFCDQCIIQQSEVWVAKKYLKYYLEDDWDQVMMLKEDQHVSKTMSGLNRIKAQLWNEEKLPFIIQGHFKINIDNDQIESFTVVLARKKDKERIQKEISSI